MEVVLSTYDLVLSRDAKPVARLPDLQVKAGETVALVGKSGSGKTTALMALTGIRAPGAGKVRLENTDPWALSSAARDAFRGRRVGLVFQSFHLVDSLSVVGNLELSTMCAAVRADPDRIDQLLQRLGIAAIRRRRVDRISHGQAQRVAVARALMNRPALIVADEPSSALDDDAAGQLLALLKDAAVSEGAALVIASHDRRVLDVADKVVEMEPVR